LWIEGHRRAYRSGGQRQPHGSVAGKLFDRAAVLKLFSGAGDCVKLKLSRALEFLVIWGHAAEVTTMCRNIKTLFNFDPPVNAVEIRAASLQFVRKISGFNKPSKANEASFLAAVDEVAAVSARLLHSLETTAPPKNREEEAAKAKARAAERFGA
jgi:hypothetical protein